MRWNQFLNPVKSFDADDARAYMKKRKSDDFILLDVRQPREYEKGHIPGAKLVPLPTLTQRLKQIDPEKGIIVYCAVGGRSRVAAQMLTAHGYGEVYNLKGGFKGWEGQTAIGDEFQGLDLFKGKETPLKFLVVAYSLEKGLRDFYLSMERKVENREARSLFKKLADIEISHQERILREYRRLSEENISREDFEQKKVFPAVEGGLTTQEYVKLFPADLESTEHIIELAMSIEAQALDLYQRAAANTSDTESRKVLLQIASEEISHLELLGKLLDSIV